MIGAGVLGLPYALRQAGWIGLVLIAVSTYATCYTAKTIVWAFDDLNRRHASTPGWRPVQSYDDLARAVTGRFGGYAMKVLLILECYGATTCFFGTVCLPKRAKRANTHLAHHTPHHTLTHTHHHNFTPRHHDATTLCATHHTPHSTTPPSPPTTAATTTIIRKLAQCYMSRTGRWCSVSPRIQLHAWTVKPSLRVQWALLRCRLPSYVPSF